MAEIRKFKDLGYKDRLSYILCIVAFIVGVILTFAGFFVPPTGIVDGSVISIIGIFLSYAFAVIGVSLHYSVELEKFKSEMKTTSISSETQE